VLLTLCSKAKITGRLGTDIKVSPWLLVRDGLVRGQYRLMSKPRVPKLRPNTTRVEKGDVSQKSRYIRQ